MARSATSRVSVGIWCSGMADVKLRLNHSGFREILHAPSVDGWERDAAERIKEAAEQWAAGHHRHKGGGGPPDFKVVREPGVPRARYTVRPATIFGTQLVQKYPNEFMALLAKGGH